LISIIITLVDSPVLRREFALAARRKVETKLKLNHFVKEMENLYGSLTV
jgi:hypothetical protein